jgi:hypothetical protein
VTEGEFAGEEFMRRLQIVREATIHIGSAIMTDPDTGEPSVGRTLVLEVEHRTNMRVDADPTTTTFGLSQTNAVELCGRLLVSIDVAFGTDVVRDLLTRAAEISGEIAAERETNDDDHA